MMEYSDLDPETEYKIRVVYAGDVVRIQSRSKTKTKMRLEANDGVEIHPFVEKKYPVQPMEFDIPREVTKDGKLALTWQRDRGKGVTGQGCQVAEVWLIKR